MSGRIARLQTATSLRVCGLMSGTSLDGIDAAIVRLEGAGESTRVAVEAFHTFPFDDVTREALMRLHDARDWESLIRMNMALGKRFADAVKDLCAISGIPITSIDLIGSHGQTVHHAPQVKSVLDVPVRGTLQIGDPAVIANETGIVCVGDFRVADCAAGGEGAPLIPAVDYILFRSETHNRVMLNIGGISNVTVLPRRCSRDAVWGFDTGPGNMIIDMLCMRFFGERFDRDGLRASRGAIQSDLLESLMAMDYFKRQPPKSTGREMFGHDFVENMVRTNPGIAPEDAIASVTDFTAQSIVDACGRFVIPQLPIDELIVSGGGAHNPVVMRRLRELMATTRIQTSDALGIPVDAKEAIGFAILANESIHEHPGNIPAVTGARRAAVLGKICL